MSEYVQYKLIVREDDACERLLRYLAKNITTIKRLGAKVRISKIDAELDAKAVEQLRNEGIVRLPALVDPSGNKIIGLKKIVELFEKNINKSKKAASTSPYGGPAVNSEFGANPELNDFYMQELFSGRDQSGKLIARKDKDEAEDEGVSNDMQRRMAEYRAPTHRTGQQGANRTDFDRDDRYDDRAAVPVRGGRGGGARETQDYPDDNIADEPRPRNRTRMADNTPPPQGPPTSEDDIEQRMWATMMNNMEQD